MHEKNTENHDPSNTPPRNGGDQPCSPPNMTPHKLTPNPKVTSPYSSPPKISPAPLDMRRIGDRVDGGRQSIFEVLAAQSSPSPPPELLSTTTPVEDISMR